MNPSPPDPPTDLHYCRCHYGPHQDTPSLEARSQVGWQLQNGTLIGMLRDDDDRPQRYGWVECWVVGWQLHNGTLIGMLRDDDDRPQRYGWVECWVEGEQP